MTPVSPSEMAQASPSARALGVPADDGDYSEPRKARPATGYDRSGGRSHARHRGGRPAWFAATVDLPTGSGVPRRRRAQGLYGRLRLEKKKMVALVKILKGSA